MSSNLLHSIIDNIYVFLYHNRAREAGKILYFLFHKILPSQKDFLKDSVESERLLQCVLDANANLKAYFGVHTIYKELHIQIVEEGVSWRNVVLCENGGNVQIGVTTKTNPWGSLTVEGGVYLGASAYTNPDYVFEQAFTGKIEKYKDNLGANNYKPMTLNEIESYAKENLRLPGITESPTDIFERGDIALEKIEQLYLFIFEQQRLIDSLTQRIIVLES